MKAHYLFALLLCLLNCSQTLASSSSSSDSERTLSIPSSPIRHLTPHYLQDTATSSPHPTRFAPLRNIIPPPAHASRTTPRIRFAPKTLRKDPTSLSAQMDRSAAYLGKKPRAHGKVPLDIPRPTQLDKDAMGKEGARRQAVNVYLRKKKLRGSAKGASKDAVGVGAPSRAGHGPAATPPRKSASPPLSAFEGHPILGPSQYPRRKGHKAQQQASGAKRVGGGDADCDWTPAREAKQKFQAKDKQRQQSKVKGEREQKGEAVAEAPPRGESKATAKEKGKGKAPGGPEPRPKMRKLLHLG